MKHVATLSGILLILSLALAAPVLAAPPTNDVYAGREAIAIGADLTVDTSEATTDADDDELNVTCEAPAMDASVWYEFTATADGFVAIDVSQSDYSAGVFVALGSPGSFEVQACAPGATVFEAVAGETYVIVAMDDQEDGAGNGGSLRLQVAEVPPPPEVSVTLDPSGRFNRDGSATISGTVTCSDAPVEFTFVDVFVQQAVGRIRISGFGFIEGFTCDGSTQSWSADVFGENGIFKGGKALTVSFGVACGEFLCGEGFEERVVQLKGKRS
jgi:Family of unknown function (DUF6299)